MHCELLQVMHCLRDDSVIFVNENKNENAKTAKLVKCSAKVLAYNTALTGATAVRR